MRLRRLPVHPTAVYGLAKEVKTAVEDFRPLVLAGAPRVTGELKRSLTAGGEQNAVRDLAGEVVTAYDLEGAGLLVYAVDGEAPSEADVAALRLAERKDVAVVAVLVESADVPDIPYVVATDVAAVPPGAPLPLEWVVERIAARAGDRGYGFAARLPVLRRAVCERIVERFSRQNGVLAAAIFIPGADLPVLTLNQIRMVFRIAAAYGEPIDRERAPELLAVVGAGFGFRAVARQALGLVPGPGWAIKGSVGYAATRALGQAAIRYFDAGGRKRLARSVRTRS